MLFIWPEGAGLFVVCPAYHRRVYSVPLSWWVLVSSLPLWMLHPVSPVGGLLKFLIPAILGRFGPGSIIRECGHHGINTLPCWSWGCKCMHCESVEVQFLGHGFWTRHPALGDAQVGVLCLLVNSGSLPGLGSG